MNIAFHNNMEELLDALTSAMGVINLIKRGSNGGSIIADCMTIASFARGKRPGMTPRCQHTVVPTGCSDA